MATEEHGYVYVFKCGPFYKVGVTLSVEGRRKALLCGNPFLLELKYQVRIPTRFMYAVEAHAHRELAEYCWRDEWFRAPIAKVRRAIDRGVKRACKDPYRSPRRMTPEEWAALPWSAEFDRRMAERQAAENAPTTPPV